MRNVLILVTAADSIALADGTRHPTGFWAEEVVATHRALTSSRHTVTIGSPGGGAATVDALSLDPSMTGGQAASDRLTAYLSSMAAALAAPASLDALDAGDFDAIVVPGGHGPMNDLAIDPDTGRLLIDAYHRRAIIGALCHGPAALLAARTDGGNVFAGYRVAAFSDEEEAQGGLGDKAPWLLASRLADAGLQIDLGVAWSEHVVVDRNLVTGQNPQSSQAFAKAVTDRLG